MSDALSVDTLHLLQGKMKIFVEDIFGLRSESDGEADKLKEVMDVLIALRKEANVKHD